MTPLKLIFLLTTLTLLCLATSADPSPRLYASSNVLSRSGDVVTLSWKGLGGIAAVISVGVTSYDGKTVASIGQFIVETSDGELQTPLVNMRQPYIFSLMKANSSTIFDSVTVSFSSFDEPLQIRLSRTDEDDSLSILFTTKTGGRSNSQLEPKVVYRALEDSGRSRWAVVTASSSTYSIDDMCGSPANESVHFIDPGFFHEATLTNLRPLAWYEYRVGLLPSFIVDELSSEELDALSVASENEDSVVVLSQSFRFQGPIGSDHERSVAFVFGDMGVSVPFDTPGIEQQYPSIQTAHLMRVELEKREGQPIVVSHIGDISYARGYAFLWEWFHALIEPIASRVPYLVGIGNHEYDFPGQPFAPEWAGFGETDSGGECGVPYSRRFRTPVGEVDGFKGASTLWYSFSHGPVFFVMMSTEHDFTTGSEQWSFLNATLASVDRQKTPWIVFQGHRPMYTTSYANNFIDHLQEHVEPLLHRYNVDLALWAHMHKYDSMCPLFQRQCSKEEDTNWKQFINDAFTDSKVNGGETSKTIRILPGFTKHVVVGNAGNDYQIPWLITDNHHQVPTKNSVFRTVEFGFCIIEATRKQLDFQFLADGDGRVHDSFTLVHTH